MKSTLILARTFLKIFSRDRQAIFFSLFFPLIFMAVFGLIGGSENEPLAIGIANQADTALAADFIAELEQDPLFTVSRGSEQALRQAVITGDLRLALVLPADFDAGGNATQLRVLVDAAQVRELSMIMPVLEQGLVRLERQLRDIEPLFTVAVEDVETRTQNYLTFLVPGLLAFTIMQISVSGSGYNIVEYRRKGILKRLFVTPLTPRAFISALVLSRSLICLVQISVLLAIAIFLLGVEFAGNLASLYLVILLGIALFLSLGFCLGSVAKTQQSIMAIGNLFTFPQMFLSGIFYPIDILPELIQPVAKLLPLSFLADGLRAITIDGASLLALLPSLFGLALWSGIALLLAVRLFVWTEVSA